jgi:hypothetical protein
MSVHCWKVMLELGRHEEKSKLEDADRVDTIMDYLLEKAPKSCFDANRRKELQCKCLSCLDNHSLGIPSPSGPCGFLTSPKKYNNCFSWRKSVQQKLYWVRTTGRRIYSCHFSSSPLQQSSAGRCQNLQMCNDDSAHTHTLVLISLVSSL